MNKTPSERVWEWITEEGHSLELLCHHCQTSSNYMRKVLRDNSCGIVMSKRLENVTGIPWEEWHRGNQ